MIGFFKKLLEKRKDDISYKALLEDECTSCLSESEDSYESSDISYDSDIDIRIGEIYKPYPNLFVDKMNHVAELKRQLCLFRDIHSNRMWFLFHALWSIKQIGFYPPGMPYTKSEVLNMVVRYQRSLEKIDNIAPYYKYLCNEDSNETFELVAKSPLEHNQIYCTGTDEFGQTLLHHSVRWNNLELTKKLLELGFNPNEADYQGKTPIFGCVGKLHHRKSKMADLLLKYGASPYHVLESGKTLIDKAVQKGNINLVILLVTKYNIEFGYRKNTFESYPKWAQKKLIRHWLN